MSVRAITWAFDTEVGSLGAKLVLLKLADHADDDGKCWPAIKTIARQCEMSERSVIRHLAYLEAEDLIKKWPQFDDDGAQTSNLYMLIGVKSVRPGRVSVWHPAGDKVGTPSGDKVVTQTVSTEPSEEPYPLPLKLKGLEKEWTIFLKHLEEKDTPLTKQQAKLILTRLEGWGVARSKTAIVHSVTAGWSSIYEPNSWKKDSTEERKRQKDEDEFQASRQRARELAAELERNKQQQKENKQ